MKGLKEKVVKVDFDWCRRKIGSKTKRGDEE